MKKRKRTFTYQALLAMFIALFSLSFKINSPVLERNGSNITQKNQLAKPSSRTRKIASINTKMKSSKTQYVKNKLMVKSNLIIQLENDLKRYYPNSKIKITEQKKIKRKQVEYSEVLVEIKGSQKRVSYNALVENKTGQVINKWNQSYPDTFGSSKKLKIDIRDFEYRK